MNLAPHTGWVLGSGDGRIGGFGGDAGAALSAGVFGQGGAAGGFGVGAVGGRAGGFEQEFTALAGDGGGWGVAG